MIIDQTNGELEKTLEFAKSIGDDSLQGCLDRLKKVEENYEENGKEVETYLMTDFAPKSFYFARRKKESGEFIGNGGIIFHGKHDNGGDGGAPTYSVCLTPCNGWQIHT
jgi:hypothetical protein